MNIHEFIKKALAKISTKMIAKHLGTLGSPVHFEAMKKTVHITFDMDLQQGSDQRLGVDKDTVGINKIVLLHALSAWEKVNQETRECIEQDVLNKIRVPSRQSLIAANPDFDEKALTVAAVKAKAKAIREAANVSQCAEHCIALKETVIQSPDTYGLKIVSKDGPVTGTIEIIDLDVNAPYSQAITSEIVTTAVALEEGQPVSG